MSAPPPADSAVVQSAPGAGASPPEEASEHYLPPIVGGGLAKAVGNAFYDPPESETTLYKVPALNVTFAVTSALLFAVTVWAIWDDHARDWKRFQSEWRNIQEDRYQQQISEEDRKLQGQHLNDLEAELRSLRQSVAADVSYRKELREAEAAENTWNLAEIQVKFHKSKLDSQRYYFEEKRKHVLDGPYKDTPRGQAELDAIEREFETLWIKPLEDLQRKEEELRTISQKERAEADALAKARDETQKKIAALVRNRDNLQRSLRGVAVNATNIIRNAPLIPPFSPTDQIQKVVLSDLTEPLNFLDVPRVDRCKVCHVNIDDPDPTLADFTDERSKHGGRLFRSHPRLDLFVGSASPHPYLQFGCTICHYGDGHSTSFEFAAHTPRDEAQAKEWEEKYGWEKLHHQDYPMLALPYISSTCAKCHPSQDRVTGASGYNQGRELVEEYGCFGCHKIEGFEKYRKVGPTLTQLRNKVDLAFLYRWIKDPPSFRPTTKMPKFFDLSNTTGTFNVISMDGNLEPMNFDARNEVEALALASYLDGQSKPRPEADLYQSTVSWKNGDAARGKELVKAVGCLGCHSIVREGWTYNDHGPDLSSIGSKVRPEWLADWIVDPRRHDPLTRMPRLRVELDEGGPQKLADMVAYLVSLRDPAFDALPVPQVDAARLKILKEIAFDYYRRNATRAEARQQVEAMPVERLLSYTGERLVLRYGCFGCHPGISPEFDKTAPIGVELTNHGSKELDKLDFGKWGHQRTDEYAIEHTRSGWFTAKLDNPRIYDTVPKEVVGGNQTIAYEMTGTIVQKTPEELLKMPLFSFRTVQDPPDDKRPEDQEKIRSARAKRLQAAVTFLLSRLNDKIPLHKTRRLSADDAAVEAGRNLIRFLNCQGCHRLGGDPQDMQLEDLPAFSYDASPDKKVLQEVEKETWLAEDVTLGKMTIPAGSFLSAGLIDANVAKPEEESSVRMIATRYWDSQKTPERDRHLNVLGFGEGKMRRYLGDAAEARPKAAPLLRKEGERVHADWLFHFLLDVKPLRPWLDLRMPSFPVQQSEAETLVRWFNLTAGAPYPPILKKEDAEKVLKYYALAPGVPYPPLDLGADQKRKLARWSQVEGRPPYPHQIFAAHQLTPAARQLAELGRDMFQVTFPGDTKAQMRLQCNSCHPAGDKKPSVQDQLSWGPDLSLARDRLRPDWIVRWVLDPGSYMPGTKMPNNFMSVKTDLVDDVAVQVLDIPRPDYDREVAALVQYMMHMREIEAGTTAAR